MNNDIKEKSIIIYYSYGGNTKEVATMIKNKLNCDILELKPKVPYSENYQTVVDQGQEEIDNGFKPELEESNLNLNDYTNIFIGSPVWWYTFAPVINTFLCNNDLSNKNIIPFITNAGWLGHTIDDIKQKCLTSSVRNAKSIKFDEHNLITPISEIDAWLNDIEYKK